MSVRLDELLERDDEVLLGLGVHPEPGSGLLGIRPGREAVRLLLASAPLTLTSATGPWIAPVEP